MGAKKKTVPPWCPFVAVEQILEKNKQVNLTKIDKNTLKIYGIGSGYENKVLSALRWLDLIDIDGNPTPKMIELRVTGKEFEDRLKDIVVEAYEDLIKFAPLETSDRNTLINYFMQRHGYSINRANIALSFLISLWKLAKFDLSEDLKTSKFIPRDETKKEKKAVSKPAKEISKIKQSTDETNRVIMLVGGKQHDFNLGNDLDKVVFEALTNELLKRWSKKKEDKDKSIEDEEESESR